MSATGFDCVSTKVISKSAAFTADLESSTYLVNATGGAVVATLPAANKCWRNGFGAQLTFKKTDASANAVTVTRAGSDTIDGANTSALAAQWDAITVQSNGTAWFIVAIGP